MKNTIRVLLIDDDEDDYITIRDLLLSEIDHGKYTLTWKSNYQDGIAALRSSKFDVCLLDYRLGEQTGLDFLRESKDQLLALPIIFLTGLADLELDQNAMQVGASDYLVKGELSATLLDRSIRHSMKNVFDMNELREMRAQVLRQDRMASLGMLASSLAHEIGTPLGIIRGRAELMVKRLSGNEALQRDAEIITAQIDRISRLVKSLLRLARGEDSEQIIDVDLKDSIENVINLMRPEMERNDIELKIDIESTLVRAQPGPLEQILLNLFVNSIHAIQSARVKGKIGKHEISIQTDCRGKLAHLSVEDTGSGIEDRHLSQLFRPFFTTKPIGEGTGLGLATSLRLAQSWGGGIEVATQIGNGTKFTAMIPRSNTKISRLDEISENSESRN
jgi:signal transduction histidine kinase